MDLVVFHYHLLPGGVTDVIVQSLLALRTSVPVDRIRLVTGRSDNTDQIAHRLRDADVPIVVEPAIDYTDCGSGDGGRLAARLAAQFGGKESLWWIHNYHLGKNGAFTAALLEIAAAGTQRMLLHIHDFPECGRYRNLACLHQVCGQALYPTGSNVHYAVINERDARILTDAGLPDAQIHTLVNPVASTTSVPTATPHDAAPARTELRRELVRRAPAALGKLDPDLPMLLYPVRTIRRKNALEAGLLTRLHGGVTLAVTLPGVSDAERAYSQLVQQAFTDGSVRGVCCAGPKADEAGVSFADMIDASDGIVSSSIQEGFGYTFVSALRWRRPLLARYLDVLDGIKPVFDGYPHRFYTSVRVPFSSPSLTDFRTYLRMRYGEQIDAVEHILPQATVGHLYDELHQMLAADSICYSFLSPHMQYAILRDLAEPTYLQLLRTLNGDLIESIDDLLAADCPNYDARIEATFGYDAYARALQGIFAAFATVLGTEVTDTAAVHRAVLDRFARLDYLRLLYAPPDREMHG